ncbi:glycosyltransferase family 2 protein [Acetobacterium bakii]|uniref:Glycosyltransferase 2-like domain-containing protein n=1 Tax=Acetobacterium bakii TaxID=52689 RepID=A0A0L6U2G9_9FIRM|nr:glycosyltransferase family 2 protein [Acetobacterium bakii]KNZ42542.1 hypothetical protein AKG39_06290 [Acetobacterium bakii]
MKKVQVLLSTFNGQEYLDDQIKSLILQEGVRVEILVRDDGSSDNTIPMLIEWESKGVLSWYNGDNMKPAKSFMNLIQNSPKSDYYAFCDQDDIWDKDKLKVAVSFLEKFDDKEPGLYFSNTRLVDYNLNLIKSNKHNPKITLGSALIFYCATGCTELFNHALIEVIRKHDYVKNNSHDNWIYKVCLAIGGNVVFDEIPHISYRQHGNNYTGGNISIYDIYKQRVKNLFTERSHVREQDAKELLKGYSELMHKENIDKVERVAFYRISLRNKINLLFDKDIKEDRLSFNFAFVCSVLLNAL